MPKIISIPELATLTSSLLTKPEELGEEISSSTFSDFSCAIAQVLCDYFGGEIVEKPVPTAGDMGSWTLTVKGNDSLPPSGGIWSPFDEEGKLFDSLSDDRKVPAVRQQSTSAPVDRPHSTEIVAAPEDRAPNVQNTFSLNAIESAALRVSALEVKELSAFDVPMIDALIELGNLAGDIAKLVVAQRVVDRPAAESGAQIITVPTPGDSSQVLRMFPNANLARQYRYTAATAGWIFTNDEMTVLFPPDVTPSAIFNHPVTKGRKGQLIGSQ